MRKGILVNCCRVSAAILLLVSAGAARGDYAGTILSDSPAGYWRLGEMPTTFDDIPVAVTNLGSLSTGADGTFIGYVRRNQPGALTGSTDAAYRFWAGDGRVTITNAAFNFTGTMPFTLEVWAKPMLPPTSSQSQRLISNGSSGVGYGFTMYGTTLLRVTGFGVADVNSDPVATPWATNTWYHLAVVRSNAFLYFYVNGVPLGAPKSLSNIKTTPNPLALGATAVGGEAFTGFLDEAAVYTNSLTPAQIAAHYAAGTTSGADYPAAILADSPIGYWRLNEPGKPESTAVIANTGSVGAAGNGSVYGSANSVTGGLPGAPVGDANPAMSFSGVNGKIDVPNLPALNTASFTVECWANMASWNNSHQSPVTSRMSGGAPGALGYILYAAPGTGSAPRWEFWTGPGWDTMAAAEADFKMNQWTHVVGTYDATTRTKLLYVDGRLVTGKSNVAVSTNSFAPLRIGAGASENGNGSFFFNGGVDEVAVYPSAMPPHRVLAHYEAGAGGAPTTVVAPAAVTAPASVTNWAPYAVTLNAVMNGTLPMQLQWYHISADGLTTNAVPNGTNMLLQLEPTTAAMTGNYFLLASNSGGTAESAQAWVEILPLTVPAFVQNVPASVPVYVGGTAGIPVVVDGTPPFSYQWQSNTVNIAAATNQVLAVPNVQPSFSTASYRAVITNLAGTSTSDAASLSVLTPRASTYAAVITAMNPFAYWRLNETGPIAFDYWGGKPGLYNNVFQGTTPGALTDDDDGAATFTGNSNVRAVETEPFNFTGTNSFSLVTWVKMDSFPANNVAARIFSNWKSVGGSAGYGLGFFGSTALRFTSFGIADSDASVTALSAGQWYHIAAVRSNTLVYLYLDGTLRATRTNLNINPSTNPLHLGSNPGGGEPLSGTLDEAAVFNRALSAAEIAALYTARYGSLVPPSVVKQPSAARVFAGGTARFEVQAVGSQPMGYQWRANGSPILNATNTSLVLSNLTLAGNGVNYTVVITNRAGNATSDPALLTVTQPAGYPAAVVADNPVALWRLGESAGPVIYDAWGGFNGQDNGTVAYNTPGALLGDPNTSATFDGFSSKIEVPYDRALNPNVYTVEAWARVTGGENTYRAVVSARDELNLASQKGFIIYATAGNIWSYWTSTGSGWQSVNGAAVVPNEWTHLAAVYDGATKYFYVNGVLQGTSTVTAVPNDIRPLRIGTGRNEFEPGEYWFFGDIDEVAIYGTALPAERIAYHVALGKYGNNTPPFMTRQPFGQSVAVGTAVTLDAAAAGSPTLQYQWLKDGAPLAGGTRAQLLLPSIAFADAGSYVLAVTNAVGYVLSSPAVLTVMPPAGFALVTGDLVLHLKFDNDYADSSGRGNNAAAVGAPTFVPGRVGAGALHYNTDIAGGAYNYASLGPNPLPDLQFSSNVNFSVSYWVRFTGTPGDLPFICSANNSYGGWGVTFAPSYQLGGWSWSLGTSAGYVGVYGAAGSINDGNWHNLVHTFDRAAGRGITYLDGVMVDVQNVNASGDIDSLSIMNIGQDPSGTYQENGSADIDDIGIWRRVITTYDAQAIYAAGVRGDSFDVTGPVRLAVERTGTNIDLYWQAGTLQQADQAMGPYTPVPGAQAPHYRVSDTAPRKFYKVQP